MDDNIEKADVPQSHFLQTSSPINIPPRSQASSPHPNHIPSVGMRTTPSSNPSSINHLTSPKPPPSDVVHPIENQSQNISTFDQELSVHIERPGGSMSISPSSRDVVLAARNGLYIIDLENKDLSPRELNNLTKWDVADVHWNPHQTHEKWVASTSNRKGLIWNVEMSSFNALEHILYGHTRAISDINWSKHDPYMIATCSVDTYIHLWDLRKDSKQPSRSFCAWKSGATQVKFNLKNEFILASSHDDNVMIWDTRKGSEYVTKIATGTIKVYGIDWNKQNQKNIITCGLDKSVKFWNIDEPDVCEGIIRTNSPVWRARHTPVGSGILTMPQRSEYTLHLWNRENLQSPVHAFVGHSDIVKEFVWRVRGNQDVDDKELQLITWSRDQNLRLWPINDQQLKLIGHERRNAGVPSDKLIRTGYPSHTFHANKLENNPITRVPDELRVFPGIRVNQTNSLRPSGASTGNIDIRNYPLPTGIHRTERELRTLSPLFEVQNPKSIDEIIPTNVHDEISLIERKFPVKLEKTPGKNNDYTITFHGEKDYAFTRVNVLFPEEYPHEMPRFKVLETRMSSVKTRALILQNLNRIARTYSLQERPCLEECVRFLISQRQEVDQDRYTKEDSDEEEFSSAKKEDLINDLYILLDNKKSKMDFRVPFPMLCGARFSKNGSIVCFFSNLKSPNVDNERTGEWTYTHPQSYEYWDQYLKVTTLPDSAPDEGDDDQEGFHSLYFRSKEVLRDIASVEQPKKHKEGLVHIHDVSRLLPVSYELATKYTLNGDPVDICKYNAQVAKELNRSDLVQAWCLASLILSNRVRSREDINFLERLPILYEKSKFSYKRIKDDPEICSLTNWGLHPLGKDLVRNLLKHFIDLGDFQMVAMLSCVFREDLSLYEWETPLSFANDTNSTGSYIRYAENSFSEKYSFPQSYQSLSTTPGQMYSESFASSFGAHQQYQLDSAASTPSVYHIAHSEGAGGSIMIPSHIPSIRHQRRSTFGGGVSKEASFFPSSSISTASSRSPIAGVRPEYFSWGAMGYYDYERNAEIEKKSEKNSDVIIVTHFDEFDDERKPHFDMMLNDDRETKELYDQFRLAYSELLYHWGLYEARAEILKYMNFIKTTVGSPIGERHSPLDIGVFCRKCGGEIRPGSVCRGCPLSSIVTKCSRCGAEIKPNSRCKFCQPPVMGIKCSICHQLVKGLTAFCMSCQHGGHALHMREWFASGYEECPTGCGCPCIAKNGGF